jgi:hypothetical protein
MGFFSWKTSDTNRSIANRHSIKSTFVVHLITEDGQVFTEDDYDGYGEFGNKDFYVLLAEINGLKGSAEELRSKGIDLAFEGSRSGDYTGRCKFPKLVENLPKKENWQKEWDNLDYPETCEFQGYFYDEE